MQKYDTYKPSGIDWLGEIPAHWQVKRVKDIGKVVLGKMLNTTEQNGYSLKPYLKSKNIGWLNVGIDSVEQMYFNQYELKQYRLKKEDLLLSEGGEVGKTCIWNEELPECYIQNSVHKITMFKNNNAHYYLYLSFYLGNCKYYDSIVNQVSIKHLTSEKLIKIFWLLPPLAEQTAIAHYLDKQTQAIDAKISLYSQKITHYKALRKSLINETVCKGLQKEVKYKDSGIEWIGEIPEHWEVKRLKDVDELIMGQSPNSNDYNFEFKGYPFLQGNAEFGVINPTPSIWCEFASKVINVNDILLSVRAPIGAVNISNQKYGIGRGLCAIRAKKSHFKFLYYHFIARHHNLNSMGTGTTYIAISLGDIRNLLVVYPPLSEQTSIASYLDSETAKIDKIVSRLEKGISQLKELRKSLINEVVTGKVRVI